MDLGGAKLCNQCADGCQCDGRAGDFANCKCEDDCACTECKAPGSSEVQTF